jgi:hypothetical protein
VRKLALLLFVVLISLLLAVSYAQQRPTPTGTVVKTTNYAAIAADSGKNIVMNCMALPCTVTLPVPPPTAIWQIWVSSSPSAAVFATISPNGLTLDASLSSLTLTIGTGVLITTDGTNYFSSRGIAGAVTSPVTSLSPFTFGSNMQLKGPSPIGFDIRRYGARPVDTRSIPSSTATINTVTPCARAEIAANTACLTSSSGFQVGDGITIQGVGPANTMTTPTIASVLPSLAQTLTGVGRTVPAPAGTTTYCYVVIGRDVGRGLTTSSPQVCTTTGSAALGSQTAPISSMARSENITKVTTSAAHGFSPGCGTSGVCGMGHVEEAGSDSALWSGWFSINTADDNLHLAFDSSLTTLNGAPSLAKLGSTPTINWFNCNLITINVVGTGTIQYFVFGRTSGSLIYLGETIPVNGASAITFEDYGPTMTSSYPRPTWVPSTPLTSATADSLTTTITSISGNTITLASAASTSATGVTAIFDDAPAAIAASSDAVSRGSKIVIPGTGSSNNFDQYVFNSYMELAGANVVQVGPVTAYDTIAGTQSWIGDKVNGANQCPQFAIECEIVFTPQDAANPAFSGGGRFQYLTVPVAGNGAISFFMTGSFSLENMNIGKTYAGDYMSIPIWINTNGQPVGGLIHRVLISGGPTQNVGSTATPLLVVKNTGELTLDGIYMNRRGMYFENSGLSYTSNFEVQGGIMPQVTVAMIGESGGNYAIIANTVRDTSGEPLFANLSQYDGFWAGTVHIINANFDTGPMVTGRPITHLILDSASLPGYLGVNMNDDEINIGGVSGKTTHNSTHSIGNSNQFFVEDLSPAAPTCATASAGPPFTANGTFSFTYDIVYPNGLVGNASAASARCTANGTSQQITITVPAAPGAIGYNFFTAGGSDINCSYVTTTSYVVPSGFCNGSGGNPISNGGPTGIKGASFWAQLYEVTPGPFAVLPACSAAMKGFVGSVSDSKTQIWGATITDGGSLYALAICDGTNWTVIGK